MNGGVKLNNLLGFMNGMNESRSPMIDGADEKSIAQISARIPGYSAAVHYAFFKSLLAATDIKEVLILGVYHGRDIAFLIDALTRYHPGRRIKIVGVDKFDDQPCADWPEEKRKESWEAAGMGPAPTIESAMDNLQDRSGDVTLDLVKSDDSQFIGTTGQQFDFIYLDTSHDYATVWRQLRTISKMCWSDTLICGDDYSDNGTWGVKRAVTQAFQNHSVFGNWIWMADNSLLVP